MKALIKMSPQTIVLVFFSGIAFCILWVYFLPSEDKEVCFRAAVYEHIRYGDDIPVNKRDPLTVKYNNLEIYKHVAKRAAEHGAAILVFPENGLFETPDDRVDARNYMEAIPDPQDAIVNPCEKKSSFKEQICLRELSCMARKNKLYLVANMGDIQPCSHMADERCPPDGFYQYNTQVAFDEKGNLIAKYHKRHLYGEYGLDTPDTEHIYFDTEFGRMGLFICFDMVFRNPGIVLINDMDVDTMIYSTWWFDKKPFLMAHEYQRSWSYSNNVNLLAANINLLSRGSVGSGIYSGKTNPVYSHDIFNSTSKLIISSIAKSPKSGSICSADPVTIILSSEEQLGYSTKADSIKDFKNVRFKERVGTLTLCDDVFCCHLDYELEKNDEIFYFLVGHRIVKNIYNWCEELCLISISKDGSELSQKSKSIFKKLEINANFNSKHVYPSVLLNDYGLVPVEHFSMRQVDNQFNLIVYSPKPIISAGLYGRCYHRDEVL